MPNVNVKISNELRKQIAMHCLERDQKQKDFVVEALATALSQPYTIERKMVLSAGVAPTCQSHHKPMKDYGTKWICEGPPQHTEAK